jgi:phospholipid/cholesterol/gamma-HCH transport system ATP-binding protein
VEHAIAQRQTLGETSAAGQALVFDDVWLAFEDHAVLRGVTFCIPVGSMRVLLGASGAGKSVVLKLALGLLRPDKGTIAVNGRRIDTMRERELLRMRADVGMLFQESALFDSLTVGDNVGYRLYEETDTPEREVRARVEEVLRFMGMEDYIERLPSELSGGQRRRVAIARAMAARPSLLLLDDPTTGLDPITATTVDDEIVKLRDLEQVTTFIVTHQIRDAFHMARHQAVRDGDTVRIVPADVATAERSEFLVLHEGRIRFSGTAAELLASTDPHLKALLFRTLPPW